MKPKFQMWGNNRKPDDVYNNMQSPFKIIVRIPYNVYRILSPLRLQQKFFKTPLSSIHFRLYSSYFFIYSFHPQQPCKYSQIYYSQSVSALHNSLVSVPTHIPDFIKIITIARPSAPSCYTRSFFLYIFCLFIYFTY